MLAWPGLAAEGTAPGVTSIQTGRDFIVLSIKPESLGDDGGKFALNREAMRWIDFSQSGNTWSDLTRARKWEQALAMYCMPGRSATELRDVCWTEGVAGDVQTLVSCNHPRQAVGTMLCTHRFLLSNGNARVELGYQGKLRPQWRLLEQASIGFIDSHVSGAEVGR